MKKFILTLLFYGIHMHTFFLYPLFTVLFFVCIIFGAGTRAAFADEAKQYQKELKEQMVKGMVELYGIDASDEDKTKAKENGQNLQPLSEKERKALAQQMRDSLKRIQDIGSEERAKFVGLLILSSTRDGKQSDAEKAALETYRSIIAPEFSMEKCVAEAEKETKKMQYKVKLIEVPVNLKGIQTGQKYYFESMGKYVAADLYPPKPTENFSWDEKKSGGFAELGWSPPGNVRSSYSITVTKDNFVATGIIDADGDGVYATFEIQKNGEAVKKTPDDVY